MTLPDQKTNVSACPGLRLLLVDDEERILRSLRRSLRRTADEILVAATGEEGLAVLDENPGLQVVVSDFRMPGMDGVEFLRRVKEKYPQMQRVMLTGYADQQAIEDAINRSEVYRFISKPWDDGHLQMTIHSAYEQWRVVEENARLFRLTQDQNASLEAKVQERTRLLSVAKAEWELSFDAIHDPLAVVDPAYVIKRANMAYGRAADVEMTELAGRKCYEALFGRDAPCEGCTFLEAMRTGEATHFACGSEARRYRVDAYRLPDFSEEEPRGVVYYRDVTDEERITRQLIQTEKMAAVGQLAGGVAHEINNPLAGILAFAQMMRSDPDRSPDDDEQLGYIESSARRAMRIVESLLTFSRATAGNERLSFRLTQLFEDVRVLAGPILKGTATELEIDVPEDLPEVRGSANRLEQVFVNLVTNAAQALQGDGTIRVRARLSDFGVTVRVEDTGAGVPEPLRGRIFEPFFTTKPEGQGTGLGLAISYRIVESHGGRLAVGTSSDLGGACFTVDLLADRTEGHD